MYQFGKDCVVLPGVSWGSSQSDTLLDEASSTALETSFFVIYTSIGQQYK